MAYHQPVEIPLIVVGMAYPTGSFRPARFDQLASTPQSISARRFTA